MILFCLGLQLLVLQPTITKSDEEAPSLKSLISDPYILIAAGIVDNSLIHINIKVLEVISF